MSTGWGDMGGSRAHLWSSELNWEGKLVRQKKAEASMMLPTQAFAVSPWTPGGLPPRSRGPGSALQPPPNITASLSAWNHDIRPAAVITVSLARVPDSTRLQFLNRKRPSGPTSGETVCLVSPGVPLPAWEKVHLLKPDISKVTMPLVRAYITLRKIKYLS